MKNRIISTVICTLLITGAMTFVKAEQLNEIECLAENIYHEARGEPVLGQVLVGQVTLNRVSSNAWEDSICEVVYQPWQFSWTMDENINKDKSKFKVSSYMMALDIANILYYNGDAVSNYAGNHYLRCDWKPKVEWWKSMVFLGQVGNHCFYTDGR